MEEILVEMSGCIEEQLSLLKPVEESWQPSDMLPNMSGPHWHDEITELRRQAASLKDDVLVVLVGNIVTEEALPSYQTWLNRPQGMQDETGASMTPWAQWTRGWTAEENRHGDLLNRYLYLSGRVDIRSVEVTTQYLIKNGFDLKSGKDPYRSIVYASFQERATKISHANTGKAAEKCGDPTLGKMCAMIATEEARHEEAYKRFFKFVLNADASAGMIAFYDMMRQKVAMPARLMSDGSDRDLFSQFAVVAQRSGIYTTRDYANVIGHLVEYWGIPSMTGLSPQAVEAQEYLCGLSEHYHSKADRVEEVLPALPQMPFSWIFERSV